MLAALISSIAQRCDISFYLGDVLGKLEPKGRYVQVISDIGKEAIKELFNSNLHINKIHVEFEKLLRAAHRAGELLNDEFHKRLQAAHYRGALLTIVSKISIQCSDLIGNLYKEALQALLEADISKRDLCGYYTLARRIYLDSSRVVDIPEGWEAKFREKLKAALKSQAALPEYGNLAGKYTKAAELLSRGEPLFTRAVDFNILQRPIVWLKLARSKYKSDATVADLLRW